MNDRINSLYQEHCLRLCGLRKKFRVHNSFLPSRGYLSPLSADVDAARRQRGCGCCSIRRPLRTAGTWRSDMRSKAESLTYPCAAHERECVCVGTHPHPRVPWTAIAIKPTATDKASYIFHPAPATPDGYRSRGSVPYA